MRERAKPLLLVLYVRTVRISMLLYPQSRHLTIFNLANLARYLPACVFLYEYLYLGATRDFKPFFFLRTVPFDLAPITASCAQQQQQQPAINSGASSFLDARSALVLMAQGGGPRARLIGLRPSPGIVLTCAKTTDPWSDAGVRRVENEDARTHRPLSDDGRKRDGPQLTPINLTSRRTKSSEGTFLCGTMELSRRIQVVSCRGTAVRATAGRLCDETTSMLERL
jgi:hypothetical protein